MRHTPCIFEYVYFARPDSIMDNISVYRARMRMGDRLAEKILRARPNHDIDVVIPIPDTSRTAALQLAQRLGLKYREGFTKNRYIGRTFIMPGQEKRERSVRRSSTRSTEFRGKNMLLVDDSIVRGTTSAQIVELAREAGARKVYFASAAPPVRFPNVYGIDMPAASELVASGRTERKSRRDRRRLALYQDLPDLVAACQHDNAKMITEFDTSCFSGCVCHGRRDARIPAAIAERTLRRRQGAATGRAPRTVAGRPLTVSRSDPRRQLLLQLLRAGLAAVDGRRCVARHLKALLEQEPARRCHVAAVGKAAAAMALVADDALGARILRTLVITKDGHFDAGVADLPGIELLASSHPMPDARSLQAGERLVEFVAAMPADVLPVFLVSGGASSLVEVLAPGCTLEDLRSLNAAGLASGEDIAALNTRRRTISRLKGGGLTASLQGRAALALFVSDVPGDDPAVIGSGILGPPPVGAAVPDNVSRTVVARIEDALQAVSRHAAGLRTWVSPSRFDGDADRLAVRLTHELWLTDAQLCVWGGESVVRLPATPGRGGRNQHLALAAARLIAGLDNVLFLAAGTDGTDGPTDAAGALVDGETCGRVAAAGLDVERSLAGADSQPALAAAGDLVHTGPTGTNVGDLAVGLKLSIDQAQAWCGRNGARARNG